MLEDDGSKALAHLTQTFSHTADETLNRFDAAANALRAYDTETNGAGRMLLLNNIFLQKVDFHRTLSLSRAIRTIHDTLKDHTPGAWWSWYSAPEQSLDKILAAARKILSESPAHGASLPSSNAEEFGSGLVFLDIRACHSLSRNFG